MATKKPQRREYTFDDFMADDLLPEMTVSYKEPVPVEPAQKPEEGLISSLGSEVWQGIKSAGRSVMATGNTAVGDLTDVELLAKSQKADSANDAQAKKDLMEEIDRRKKLNPEAGWTDAVKDVASAAWDNPKGTAQLVASQLPNSAVALGGGWAGAKAGAVAGAALGSAVPVVGTAIGGVAGSMLGGLAGMFLGNFALETGGKAMDKAGDGFTQQEASDTLVEGAKKAGVITGVDTLTLGVGKLATRAFASTAVKAGARAEAKVLADAGVDITNAVKISEALANAELRASAKAAGEAAAKAASTATRRAGNAATGFVMETGGEGVGEYYGEEAATGNGNVYDAAIEAVSSASQSAVQTAQAMRESGSNNLNQKNILKSALAESGGVLSRATTQANPDLKQDDPFTTHANEVATVVQADGLLDKLRAIGPQHVQPFLDAFNVARNPNAPAAARQEAINTLDLGMQWIAAGATPDMAGTGAPYSTALTPVETIDPVTGVATTEPAQPGRPQLGNQDYVDTTAQDVSNRLPGQTPQLTNTPSPTLSGFFNGAPNGLPGSDAPTGPAGPADPAGDAEPSLGSGDRAVGPAEADTIRPAADDLGAAAGAEPAAADATLNAAGAPIEGAPIDETWTAFHPESGTLNIPRAQMPQIKSEHRGAMTNFLKARGITATEEMVPADTLMPTQAEFNQVKVDAAKAFAGNDRPVLVSSDGHILDGHHQWLAKAQNEESVKITRLNAPMADLLAAMKEFPSAGMTKDTKETQNAQAAETIQAKEEGPQAPSTGVTNNVISEAKLVEPPRMIQPEPASEKNPGTAQSRKRKAQLQHMARQGFTQVVKRDGQTLMWHPARNEAVALGSGMDVSMAQQAVASVAPGADTGRQTTGVQNGKSTGAVGASSAAKGAADIGAGGTNQGGQRVDGGVLPRPDLRNSSPESYGSAGRALQDAARDAADVAVTGPRIGSSAVSLAPSGNARTQALNKFLDVFGGLIGKRGIAISDPRAKGADDGVFDPKTGRYYVNIDGTQMESSRSVVHEAAHSLEDIPEIATILSDMWRLVPTDVRKAYFEGYKYKNISFDDTLEAARQGDQVALVMMGTLQREMMADFMSGNFHDRVWLEALAQKKPYLFQKFIEEWIPMLGKMLDMVTDLVRKMEAKSGKVSSLRLKDIDALMTLKGYAKELAAMKILAMDVAEAWVNQHPGMAQKSNIPGIMKSGKEEMDLDFLAELNAEMEAEQNASGGVVSDAQIKSKGLAAEEAFEPLRWLKGKAQVQDLYKDGYQATLSIDAEADGLFGTQLVGTWVGPANTEAEGYATQKMVKAFVHRFVASKELRDRKFDLASAVTPAQKNAMVRAWKGYNSQDGVRRYDVVGETLPMKAIAAKMGLTRDYDVSVTQEVMDQNARTMMVEFVHKVSGDVQAAVLELNKVDGKWLGTANTSSLGRSGLGAAVYQLLTEFAGARDITIHPDHSLSGVNTYRRTEQMLSAAMRTRKSNVMVPHPTQRIYGFNNQAATESEHDDNLARMLLAGLRNVQELAPGAAKLVYHPETGAFTNAKGVNQEAAVQKMLADTDARAFGLSRATLARAALTRMALSGEAAQADSFKEPILYSARETAEVEYQAVQDRYKDTEQWLRAPDGSASKLTQRQWVQTRTPSFKSWFGDWELGNIWGRDDVSKAVGSNGEPLVVYHGTDKGGFMAFKEPGGNMRGDLGIFTTDNYNMARSYVRKGRPQDMAPMSDVKKLEEAEVEVYSYQGRTSSKDTEDKTLFGFRSTWSGDEDGYASHDDAQRAAVELVDAGDEGVSKAGVYAAFVNIRSPNEDNFEGALWSGEREHLWTVVVDGETQTKPDGKQYFEEDEAREFAKQFPNPLYEDDDGSDYLTPADDHHTTTDGVVREARDTGSDGAIIREVVDDGGGPGYGLEPSDVFVAFKPNQLKSADFNTGEFGGADDMRYSVRPNDFTDPADRVEVSTTVPSAKSKGKVAIDAVDTKWIIDAKDVLSSKSHKAAAELAISNYNSVDLKDQESGIKALYSTSKDNLIWLHNLMPSEIRARAKLWYDGANKMANGLADRYNLDIRQVSGVFAVLSPQKDWFMNTSLGERVVTIFKKHGKEAWSPAMTDWVRSYVAASKTTKERAQRRVLLEVVRRAEGKTMEELDIKDAAKFVRVFDETYYPRRYRVVTPEGGFGEFVTTGSSESDADADDVPAGSIAWGGYGTIEKAVAILRDNNPKSMFRTISGALGGEHKVRNFYNNIVRPNSADGHVTIDTHAVAAALFKALSGASIEVLHNFGSTFKGMPGAGRNANSGAGGMYGIYAEAYRDAAAELGILPRELQSITWEAIRTIFLPQFKSKRAGDVNALFNRHLAGEITREEARQMAFEMGGGFKPLPWEGTPAGKFIQDGGTSFEGDLSPSQAMRQARTMEAVEPVDAMQVSITASTEAIPWIKKLYSAAKGGNELAHAELQYLTLQGLKDVLKGKANIKMAPSTGLYGGYSEPSLAVTVSFRENKRQEVLAALRQFADNYKQEQIHVRQSTKSPAGTQFTDGSYVTPVYQWKLKSAMDRKQIQSVIDQSGLKGLTFGEDFVEAYFVNENGAKDGAGMEITHDQQRSNFDTAIKSADRLMGSATEGVRRSAARLWPHGRGSGGIGWGSADSNDSDGAPAIQRSERDASGPGNRRRASDGATVRQAVHYGKVAGLTQLAGSSNGTGIKGAEDQRLKEATDPRIKQRVYFYVPVAGGIPQPEVGLGGSVYQSDLANIYDSRVATRSLSGSGNSFESAVLDAGYDGYTDPESGVVVVLGRDVPVKQIGNLSDFKIVPRLIERIIPKVTTRAEGDELVRKPQGQEMMAIIKNRMAIEAGAPSFRLEYGFARVQESQAKAVDLVLSGLGSSFRFTPEMVAFAGVTGQANGKIEVNKTLEKRQANMRELLACLG